MVVLAALHESLVDLVLSKPLCQLGYAPVIERLLKGDAHRLRLQVLGHVAILLPEVEGRAGMDGGGRGETGLELWGGLQIPLNRVYGDSKSP